jgi:hypothetical protein
MDWASLPVIRCELSAEEVQARVENASKRGRLPGYHPGVVAGSFSVVVFGGPFDYEMRCAIESHGLRARCAMLWKIPLIFLVGTLITIWPGVWLTDKLIPGEWNWIETWKWYLPLAIIPTPWYLWSCWRKSRAAAWAHALETLDNLAKELDAQVAPAP